MGGRDFFVASGCLPAARRPAAALAQLLRRLHGLGFAGALAEIGLPESQLWLALAAFNIGIELGQVAVVVALTGLAWVLRALARAPSIRHAHTTAAYAMGTMGAFWCIDRGALLLPPVW